MASEILKGVPGVGALRNNKFNGSLSPFADADYFRGSQSSTRDKIIDPFVTGYAFIKWIHIPQWVVEPFGGADSVKAMFQKNTKAVQGLQSLTLNTEGTQAGLSTNELHHAMGIQKNQGFSTTNQEYSGSPCREIYTHWVSGIRDPQTNLAMYPNWTPEGEYGAKYHTGEAMYIVMRPDAYNKNANGRNIEFATYITNIQPTVIPMDHLNFQAGQNSLVEFEQQFTGDLFWGPRVMEAAKAVIASQDNIYNVANMGAWQPPKA